MFWRNILFFKLSHNSVRYERSSVSCLCLGPSLPRALRDASMITSPDGKGVILIGGHDVFGVQSILYQLNCTISGCKWHEMKQVLEIGRSSFVAMIIPDSLTNCTKP
jgi:hypothetical protein